MSEAQGLRAASAAIVVIFLSGLVAYLTGGPDLADVLVCAGLAFVAGYLLRTMEVSP